jgi:hypothetical protein
MRQDIENLGISINSAFDKQDATSLEICIAEGTRIEGLLGDLPDEKMTLYYYVGNAWSNLDVIRSHGKQEIWSYNREEHINAIKSFRKCVAVPNATAESSVNIGIQAYTNLGNMFSSSGRMIFAIESWKKALGISAHFGMAGCNLAQGLLHYALSMYDDGHIPLVLRRSYKLFQHHIEHPSLHSGAKTEFQACMHWIEKNVDPEFLSKDNSFKVFSLGRGRREEDYKNWVLRNSLFLNPLNDLFYESAIAHDVLQLPNMRFRDTKAPVFHGFFNQMKQEFITARYLFYQYTDELPEHKVHFSDKGRKLVNTLDYTQHGLRYEMLKNSFRMLYSIFDKVAYFVNEYFGLGVNRKRVYFRSVWFEGKTLNPKLEQFMNNPLRGLYFLSKDFDDEDEEYLSSTDPEARNMSELRNNIEHKYFKLHWFEIPKPTEELRFDPIAYSITEEEMKQKVLRLLRSAREALIYLSLSVHCHEKKSRDGGVAMPLFLGDYD